MRFSANTVKKMIKSVDYIPLQLRTDKECQATEYFNIRKGDRSLLEFAFDSKDSTIHRITLLICEEYRKTMKTYYIPDKHKNGDVLIDGSGEIDTPTFRCVIYPNAVRIVVSDADSSECISSENLVWELTNQGDLVSICVLDPTGIVSEHCFRELEANLFHNYCC